MTALNAAVETYQRAITDAAKRIVAIQDSAPDQILQTLFDVQSGIHKAERDLLAVARSWPIERVEAASAGKGDE